MKKPSYLLILLFLLLPLVASAQRSVSVNAQGIILAPADLFIINSNALDTAISRDVLGNVNTATLRFADGTNTGTFRAEGTISSVNITNSGNFLQNGAAGFGSAVTMGSTLALLGAQTNASSLLVNGAVGFGSTLSIAGAQTNVTTLLVNGAVGFGSTLAVSGAITPGSTINFPDNVRQTFNPGANASGINVGSAAAAPDTPSNGDLYYDTTLTTIRARNNGAWVNWGTGGGGGDDKVATNSGTAWNLTANLRSTFNGSIASTATNLTHATHNEFVMDGPRYGRMSMQGDTIIGVIPPATATTLGMVAVIRVLEANATPRTITWSNITTRGPLPVVTGTNLYYVNWDGTNFWVDAGQLATTGNGGFLVESNAPTINSPTITGSPTIAGYVPTSRTLTVSGTGNEIDISGGTLDLSANRSWSASLSATIDLGGKTSLEIPNSAAPTTDVFGEIAGDNNAWASGRGAVQFFDGTANTWLIGVLTSDTPSDLQVPKFNIASGTITWENDNNSGAATAFNDFADATANGVVALAGFTNLWTSTLDGGFILTIDNTDADRAANTVMLMLRDADINDANAIYMRMGGDSAGTPTTDYEWRQDLYFQRIAGTNASTQLIAGAVGLGSTLDVAGNATLRGTVAVTGAQTNQSTLLVSGAAGFGSTIAASGNITSSGALVGSIDGTTAGTTLKFKNYLYLKGPDLVQNGGMLPNTNDVTANTFGKVLFSNSADEASNYTEWHIQVPDDIDTSVDLRARVIFKLTGADTGTQRYVLSHDDVANSATYAGTMANSVSLDFAGDGSGANNDVESVGFTTLTGWAGAVTAGRHWAIRLARDGNATEDGSTVDSMLSMVVIEYGTSQ